MQTTTTTTTRNESEYKAIKDRLADLAESDDKAAFEDALSAALWTQWDPPRNDYRSYNIGQEWISANPELFGQMVDDVDIFLREHFGCTWAVSIFLMQERVLRQVSEDRRREFIRDAFIDCGAFNFGPFVETIRSLDWSDEEIRGLVRDRVLSITGEDDHLAGTIHDLIEGHRAFFDGYEVGDLEKIFLHIAPMKPRRLMRLYSWLQGRLPEEVLGQVYEVALGALDGIRGVSPQDLRAFPMSSRVSLLRRLDTERRIMLHDEERAAQIFYDLVVDASGDDVVSVRALVLELGQSGWFGAVEYLTMLQVLLQCYADQINSNQMLRVFKNLFTKNVEDTHVLGRIRTGTFVPRGGSPQRQLEVRGPDDITYVRHRGDYKMWGVGRKEVWHSEGQLVAIPRNTERTKRLTPYVRAATFIYVSK